MIPVVELLRVSTESQAAEERAGLAGQHASNLQTAERFGLELVATVEIVESGATVARSPQMAQVLDLVARGAARGIVLAEYSRLFRPDRWDDMIVLQTLSDHDARIYLPTGPIDLQSELGYVQATINNLLAAMERRRIRERMDRGTEEHRRRGEHVAGGVGVPMGLAYSRENGWTYTAGIERVREAFRRFLAGERNIAALAKSLGLPRTTCAFVLQNEVYAGWRVYDQRRDMTPGGQYQGGRDRRKIDRAPAEVIRVRLPLVPVVSEDDFALVQQILALMATRRAPRTASGETFLYRGFLRCAHDDQPLYGVRSIQASGSVHFNYVCPSRTQKRAELGPCRTGYMAHTRLHEVLDRVVTEQLTDAGLLVEALGAYVASQDAGWRTARADLAAVQNQLATLRGKRERTLELYVDGLIDRAERDRRLLPLADEEAALAGMLNAAPAPLPEALSAALLCDVAATFAEWRYMEQQARRRVLEATAPTFWLDRYDVRAVSFPAGDRRDSGSRFPAADHLAPSGLYIPLRRLA